MRPNDSSTPYTDPFLEQAAPVLSRKSLAAIAVGFPTFVMGSVVFVLDSLLALPLNTDTKKLHFALELAATTFGFLLLGYYCCTEGPCSRVRQRFFSSSNNKVTTERTELLRVQC